MSRTSVRAAGAVLCLLALGPALGACSSSPTTPQPRPSSSTPTIVPSGPNDVDGEMPAPLPAPTWDPQARDQAVQSATAAMTVFASHEGDASAWWQRLSPMLSAQAAADYAGTDPTRVPAHTITGAPTLVDDASAYLAKVDVPTDVGVYQVLLSRSGDGQPWLVERLSPPAGLGAG